MGTATLTEGRVEGMREMGIVKEEWNVKWTFPYFQSSFPQKYNC